ncbi:hypothetical protein [Streptomyces sp. CA-253872]|uniref:hypothetical protein n=1 Tax=Streptomyces sp. CA-253872 TaxID=3240067 RepID=UPI003D8E68FF
MILNSLILALMASLVFTMLIAAAYSGPEPSEAEVRQTPAEDECRHCAALTSCLCNGGTR